MPMILLSGVLFSGRSPPKVITSSQGSESMRIFSSAIFLPIVIYLRAAPLTLISLRVHINDRHQLY